MKVLVTGGTGYLGRAVVRALVIAGHDPVVFSRRASASGMPGRLIDGDVRDAEALRRAIQDCPAVCHLSGLVSLWRPRPAEFDEVNVGGLRNVLTIARERGTPRLLYTSSFLALPPAGKSRPLAANDYQRTKVLAERFASEAAAAGAPLVRVYPGVVYGPGVATEGNLVGRLLGDHLAGRLPGVVGGDRIWSFAWIDEVARAHVNALIKGSPGSVYYLGGENAPQMRLFEIVRERTGNPLPRRIPYAVASMLGAVEETRAKLSGGMPLITRATVDIFREDWPLDSSEAERDLDYRVRRLEDGVADMLLTMAGADVPAS